MKHVALHEELQETAAFYALGGLSQAEASAFERHLAEGCEVCRLELEAFAATAASIGMNESEPVPERLRDELADRIKKEASPGDGNRGEPDPGARLLSVHSDEGKWRKLTKGVMMKRLFVDEASGFETSLVKMLPGTHLPRHKHNGVEQFFILEGDCHVHGEVLAPGDFHCAEAGTIHQSTYTEGGTLFLLLAPKGYMQIEAQ